MRPAPDAFGSEVQVGWRNWRFDTNVGRLSSPFFHREFWPPLERIEAGCHDYLSPRHVGGEGHPTFECSCGIYIHDSADIALEKYMEDLELHPISDGRVLVFGRASIWGTTIEHDYGWRGQYGYPYEILVPEELPAVGLDLPVFLEETSDRAGREAYDPKPIMTEIRNTYRIDAALL